LFVFTSWFIIKNEPNKICDLKLAALTEESDLIIGGHTHTFLDKPTIVKTDQEMTF
jgi:predicted phosphodiesterase